MSGPAEGGSSAWLQQPSLEHPGASTVHTSDVAVLAETLQPFELKVKVQSRTRHLPVVPSLYKHSMKEETTAQNV